MEPAIDEYMRTSEEDVFKAGDCCVVKYNPAKHTCDIYSCY